MGLAASELFWEIVSFGGGLAVVLLACGIVIALITRIMEYLSDN